VLLVLNPFARTANHCKAQRATEADAEAGEVATLSVVVRVSPGAGAGRRRHWQRRVVLRRGNRKHIWVVLVVQ
jgi:hypothetical protein